MEHTPSHEGAPVPRVPVHPPKPITSSVHRVSVIIGHSQPIHTPKVPDDPRSDPHGSRHPLGRF
jgi:hypothetical protein